MILYYDRYTTAKVNIYLYRPAPKNEDEMMVLIFEYMDRLFNIVRPRRVLYMAIDGVVIFLFSYNQLQKFIVVAK